MSLKSQDDGDEERRDYYIMYSLRQFEYSRQDNSTPKLPHTVLASQSIPMSVFEPRMVTVQLRNSSLVDAKDRKAFCTNWANSVSTV